MDALASFDFNSIGGGGLFTKFESGKEVTLRVLTTDPMVVLDKFGNTKFAFIVWNFDESKAQVLNKGKTVAEPLQHLHLNQKLGANIQKIDVGITAIGSGKEVKYTINNYPYSGDLTTEQITEARNIDLEKLFPNGVRISGYSKGQKPTQEVGKDDLMEPITADNVDQMFANDSNDIDISEIPF